MLAKVDDGEDVDVSLFVPDELVNSASGGDDGVRVDGRFVDGRPDGLGKTGGLFDEKLDSLGDVDDDALDDGETISSSDT